MVSDAAMANNLPPGGLIGGTRKNADKIWGVEVFTALIILSA